MCYNGVTECFLGVLQVCVTGFYAGLLQKCFRGDIGTLQALSIFVLKIVRSINRVRYKSVRMFSPWYIHASGCHQAGKYVREAPAWLVLHLHKTELETG